jgi:hypothetical protein
MPLLDLTDLELETAARACRAMAYQEGERARKMENPSTRGPIENTAKRYAALADKFERVRVSGKVLLRAAGLRSGRYAERVRSCQTTMTT